MFEKMVNRGVWGGKREGNSSANTKVVEGGGGSAPGSRAEIPQQHVEKTC